MARGTITISAELVLHVRRGAHFALSGNAEELKGYADAHWSATDGAHAADMPLAADYALAIGGLKLTLALLDAIGWSGPSGAVTLDLDAHGNALEAALDNQLEDLRENILPNQMPPTSQACETYEHLERLSLCGRGGA